MSRSTIGLSMPISRSDLCRLRLAFSVLLLSSFDPRGAVHAQYGRNGVAVPLADTFDAGGGGSGYGRLPPGDQSAILINARGVDASAGKSAYSPLLPPTNDVYMPPPEIPSESGATAPQIPKGPTSDQLVPQLPTGPELSVEPNPTVPAPSTGPGLNELGKRILAPPQVQFQIRNLGPNPEGIPGFGASAYAHTPKPSSPAAVQPSAASSSSAQSLPTKTDGSNLMGSVSGVPATAPPAAAPLVPAASSGPCPAVVPAAAGAVPVAEPAVPAAVAESAYGGGAEPAAPAPVPLSAAVQNAVGGTPVPSVAEGPLTAAIGQSSVPESPVIAPLQMPSAAAGEGTENAEQINVPPPTSGPAVAPA
uniref:DUF4774 domain-containing protein n=1 Tax=Globodera pallida TaxID=36090 RepID=A0A183CQ53_GLOPA